MSYITQFKEIYHNFELSFFSKKTNNFTIFYPNVILCDQKGNLTNFQEGKTQPYLHIIFEKNVYENNNITESWSFYFSIYFKISSISDYEQIK